MSKQAEVKRATAAFELEESMRQAQRYLNSKTVNVRLVQQKADKVAALETELKKVHLQYCEKSNIDINSEEEMKYIRSKCDAAVDVIDECMLYIEEVEERKLHGDTQKEKNEKELEEIQRCKSQIRGDERYALDISKKITDLVAADRYTADNKVLMRTYWERLQEIFESLNRSWNTLIALNDITENIVKTSEVTEARIQVQDVLSAAIVFMERCEKLEEDKKVAILPSPTTGTTTGVSVSNSSSNTKNERLKNPTFSGDIRTYMKFKKDFKEIVEPNYQGAQLSYVLRESCLQGHAKALVQNIDKVEDIWEKLKDRYGDTMHLVEIVIKELNELPVMKGSDDRKLIAMVDWLEKGLQNLEAIDRDSYSKTYYCEIYCERIEDKLSRMTYLNWRKN